MPSTPTPGAASRRPGRPGRLTDAQVLEVLEGGARGLSDSAAGALVGISKTLAYRIRSGQRYNHVARPSGLEPKEQDA